MFEHITEKELNFIQKVQLKIRGFTCIGLEKRKGWSTFRKIYLVKCPYHGLYSGAKHSLYNVLPQCPKCMQEEIEKSKKELQSQKRPSNSRKEFNDTNLQEVKTTK